MRSTSTPLWCALLLTSANAITAFDAIAASRAQPRLPQEIQTLPQDRDKAQKLIFGDNFTTASQAIPMIVARS
jgi:hypothetical protein